MTSYSFRSKHGAIPFGFIVVLVGLQCLPLSFAFSLTTMATTTRTAQTKLMMVAADLRRTSNIIHLDDHVTTTTKFSYPKPKRRSRSSNNNEHGEYRNQQQQQQSSSSSHRSYSYAYGYYAAKLVKLARTPVQVSKHHLSRGREAELLFRQMQKHYDAYCKSLNNKNKKRVPTPPNSYCMTLVITAYANSGHPRAHEHCQRLLNEMLESGPDFLPDVVTYTAVLKAIGRSNPYTCGPKAEELFVKDMNHLHHDPEHSILIQPNIYSYGVLIDAWCRCHAPQSPERAEYWLRKLEYQYIRNNDMTESHGDDNNTFNYLACYTNVIEAWSKIKRVKQQQQQHHQQQSHQQQTHLVSGSNNPERAEALLLHMEHVYDETQNEQMKPDAICYAHVINAWGKSGLKGGAERAQSIWMHMENRLQTTKKMASTNSNPNTNNKQMMRNSFKSWNDCVLYTSVLDAWAREGNPEKAMEFFNHVTSKKYNRCQQKQQQQQEDDYNDNGVMPNSRSYTALIQAFAKSTKFDRAQQARRILDDMIHLYKDNDKKAWIRPSIFTYTAVLQACLCSSDQVNKDTAYRIAMQTWSELCGHDNYDDADHKVGFRGPNNVAYLTMIKTIASCRTTQHKDTDDVISNIFKQCCQDGMVHINIIRQLQRCVSTEIFEDLVTSQMMIEQQQRRKSTTDWQERLENLDTFVSVEAKHLPASWSCNVVRK